jgi:hypothetical protein
MKNVSWEHLKLEKNVSKFLVFLSNVEALFFKDKIWFKSIPSIVLIEVTNLVVYVDWALHMLRHLKGIQ